MVFDPLILIEVPEPASPLTALTWTLEALEAKELAKVDSPERVISAGVTETLVEPCLSLSVSKPSAVTETAFRPIASTAREKFWVALPEDISTSVVWVVYPI